MDMKIEAIILPVADVERAKTFYAGLGWRQDADFAAGDTFRILQFTPPGSQCSIQFGKGVTTAAPGSVQGLYLVVTDIEAARTALANHGVRVGDIYHVVPGEPPGPGRDPQGRSYASFVDFADPDGNKWRVQEITQRLPGR
jgi:catechol 2,3-dioxygenase-like lactoylglutathione lyase family enzyme